MSANGAALVHARGKANGAADGKVMVDVRLVDYIIANLPPQKRAEMLSSLAGEI